MDARHDGTPPPAGHSSWAASGLGYLSQFLFERLQPLSAPGAGHPWRLAVAAVPACGAIAIGITRYVDYWCVHSSAGCLCAALVGQACRGRRRGWVAGCSPGGAPLTACACTRACCRHHWTDVVSGLALGFIVSALCYKQQAVKLAELDADAAMLRGRMSEPEADPLLRPVPRGGPSLLPM